MAQARDDQRLIEKTTIMFAEYSDIFGLKMADVSELSEKLQAALDGAIDDVRMGRPASDKDAWPDVE